MALTKRVKQGISLVLGAGVSASAKVPIWSQLLKQMCACYFQHWQNDIQNGVCSPENPPSRKSLWFTTETHFHTERSNELGTKFTTKDLLLAAQQIKNCIRDDDFQWLLRHCLFDPLQYEPTSSSLIDSLVGLCQCENTPVKSIISYNYDDLIRHALSGAGSKSQIVYEGRSRVFEQGGLPIYFVHGCTPIKGGFSSRIVLAESDYQQEAASPFAWGNQIQLQHFAQRTCLFVGNSMTDPNSRRLLRLARTTSDCPHYCLLPRSDDPDEQLFEALFDKDLAQQRVFSIRFPKLSTEDCSDDRFRRLPELIQLIIKIASSSKSIWEQNP